MAQRQRRTQLRSPGRIFTACSCLSSSDESGEIFLKVSKITSLARQAT
jgi:hypothetical protein